MSLVSDIISQAFVDLGVITVNQTITPTMQGDGFVRLNQFLGSSSAEGLTVPNQAMNQFPLQAGVTAYTLGAGGSFNANARAMKITAWRAFYGNVLHSGGRVLSMAEFGEQAKQVLGEQTAIPQIVGADTSYPLINVRVFPPPSQTPGQIELAYWVPLALFVTVNDAINLPQGWEDYLHFGLAERLYPQYQRPSNLQYIRDMATKAKAALVEQNAMSAPQPQPAAPQGQQ